jgi:hypothetical protein
MDKKMKTSLVKKNEVTLPQINTISSQMLNTLTEALGAPRDVLATDDQIAHAWDNLPKVWLKCVLLLHLVYLIVQLIMRGMPL